VVILKGSGYHFQQLKGDNMGYRLTKIYTRTGDDGTTGLDAKTRLKKNSARIEAIGTVDELNSVLGMLIATDIHTSKIKEAFTQIQHDLFDLGGELSLPKSILITPEKVGRLEHIIDDWNNDLPPLKEFILPGGNFKTATCHLARAICRRAERCLVTLHEKESLSPEILRYINRLSDLLFVGARLLAQEANSEEVYWEHDRKKS
jgi:cob(I)alamin adenosyltransferase